MLGETASIDMPGAPAKVVFVSNGGAPSLSLDHSMPTITLANFDSPTGVASSAWFTGGGGTPAAGKRIYLAFAVYTIGTTPNISRVIHFTVVIA